jgi:hypothetical protein
MFGLSDLFVSLLLKVGELFFLLVARLGCFVPVAARRSAPVCLGGGT